MTLQDVIVQLESLSNPNKILLKKEKFGISANNSLGIYHQDLKVIAKNIGTNNQLALALFDTGIYEAKLLCSKIYQAEELTTSLMDKWVVTFENWEICDSFCMGFFVKSEFALPKAFEWIESEQEFIKRAGFVIMAAYGFAHKSAGNDVFESFLPVIRQHATDDRLYVKKAINWALRNIGKRNEDLNTKAIATAYDILEIKHKAAQWIAKNALNELEKESRKYLDYPRSIYRKMN
jgi:3-methyladenine DNA glycosylase AlkD